MLIVRFNKNDEIVDQEVTLENAHCVFKNVKKRYGYTELLLIENGVEHFVWA